ncbi:MAG: MerR family DNA-binding protein [Nitrospiraceae bacterium]|nr:MerR family DNA-binding protein [Nitrospiraceae bacterium]
MDRALTIRKLATETGVSSKTLRYWESCGLLPKPGRTHTGYRVYPVEAVQWIQFIRKAKSIGFTLAEIRTLFASPKQGSKTCETVDAWARRKLKTLDQQIELLTQLRTQLEQHRRRWRGRLPCPPLGSHEICCLIEELPSPTAESRRR